MTLLTCVSPIDGSLYAQRESLPTNSARSRIAQMRQAQSAWAARPIAERAQNLITIKKTTS